MIYTKTDWDRDALVEEGFRSEIKELGVGCIWGGGDEYVVQLI